jgi:hypothetical protein
MLLLTEAASQMRQPDREADFIWFLSVFGARRVTRCVRPKQVGDHTAMVRGHKDIRMTARYSHRSLQSLEPGVLR